jgi:Protein of unknown function (DUF763)
MTGLDDVITEAIILKYGRYELLRRLAHPFWFQSCGAVMGMDWHSSGITTNVIGALKRGLTPPRAVSGRGNHLCQTPRMTGRTPSGRRHRWASQMRSSEANGQPISYVAIGPCRIGSVQDKMPCISQPCYAGRRAAIT